MTTTLTEKTLILLTVVALIAWIFVDWQWGMLLLGFVFILMYVSGKQISADPPSVAKPTLWGRRRKKIYIKERVAFVLSYFPIVEDLIIVDRRQKEQEIAVKGVRCKVPAEPAPQQQTPPQTAQQKEEKKQVGGVVTVKVQTVWEPDWMNARRLDEYINVGREAGVRSILDGIVSETARQVGAEKDWETLALEKELLSVEIISRIVGFQPTQRVKTVNGKPVRNTRPEPGKYEIDGDIPPDREPNPWEIEHFLDTVLLNGPSDVRGLGIRLRRCNVSEVQPEGELAKDAELRAREGVQRAAEEYDFDTEIRLARKYMEEAKGRDEQMTLEQALERVRINRRPNNVREVVVRSSGSSLTDAAALIAGTQGGRP